jgi:hypothetical protein
VPPELEPAWPCYRLVIEQLATWTEVSTMMDIDDVDLLNIAADAVFDALNAPAAPVPTHRKKKAPVVPVPRGDR